jgi:hypothetical protein
MVVESATTYIASCQRKLSNHRYSGQMDRPRLRTCNIFPLCFRFGHLCFLFGCFLFGLHPFPLCLPFLPLPLKLCVPRLPFSLAICPFVLTPISKSKTPLAFTACDMNTILRNCTSPSIEDAGNHRQAHRINISGHQKVWQGIRTCLLFRLCFLIRFQCGLLACGLLLRGICNCLARVSITQFGDTLNRKVIPDPPTHDSCRINNISFHHTVHCAYERDSSVFRCQIRNMHTGSFLLIDKPERAQLDSILPSVSCKRGRCPKSLGVVTRPVPLRRWTSDRRGYARVEPSPKSRPVFGAIPSAASSTHYSGHSFPTRIVQVPIANQACHS